MAYPAPDGRFFIVPSILSADTARLGDEVDAAARAGADGVSVDVMDGHFVPNLSFGPAIAEGVRRRTRLPLDSHLMVERPERFIEAFAKAGVDLITIHVEACRRPRETLRRIRELGLKAGLAVRPKTPAKRLTAFIDEIDLALVMTVEPGFGGQAFLKEMLPKVAEVRRAIGRRKIWLQVDGGINDRTAADAAEAGADNLVAGSAFFGAKDRRAALEAIRASAERARRPAAV
jgi:ribulose-phosphate 3-epimerase